MNLFFLERKRAALFSQEIFISGRSLAATSAQLAPATHRQPPVATVPHKLPAVGLTRSLPATIRSGLSIAACSSTQSTGASVSAMRLVRITHPFHPLSGKEVACVGERYNRYGR